MKKGQLAALAVLTLVLGAGCTSQRDVVLDGKPRTFSCYGLFNQQEYNPKLRYAPEWWNVFWGAVGWELIAPPVYVFGWATMCPVGLAVAGEPGEIKR